MNQRDEHIASIIGFVFHQLDVKLLPQGETTTALTIWALIDDAIETEVAQTRAKYTYDLLMKVSPN